MNNNWNKFILKDLIEIRGSKNITDQELISFIPMEEISDQNIYTNFINKGREEIKSYTYCEAGDVLLAKITPSLENGKQGIVPPNVNSGKALATTEVFPIKCSNIHNIFLYYLLKHPKYRHQIIASMIGTTGRQRATKKSLENLEVEIPQSIKEQKSIAQILSTVDEAIQKADEAIEHTERLKRGLMHKLLTEGIGHTEFKETKVGRIPKEWEVTELGFLFNLASGKSRPQGFSEIKNEMFSIPIYGGNGILGYTNQSNINNEVIVIGRVGEYCGSVHIAPRESWITDNALFTTSLKLVAQIDFNFLKISLEHMNLNNYSRKSGQPLITQSIISNLLIILPLIAEQKKIVQIIFLIDNHLKLLKERKYLYTKIKQGLMNDLLTGKKRVVLN